MRSALLLPLLLVCSLSSANKVDSLRALVRDVHLTDSVRLEAFRKMIWKGYLFSDPDSARLLADSMYRMAGRKGMTVDQGDAFSIRGITYMISGEFKAALVELKKAEERFIKAGSGDGVAAVQLNLGNTYWKMGDLSRAIELYTKSLEHAERSLDTNKIATSEINIGLIYSDLSDTLRAQEHWQRALVMAEAVANLNSIAIACYNLSNSTLMLGDTAASIAYLQRATRAFKEVGNMLYYGNSLGNLAQQLAKAGRYAEAHRLVDSSLAVLGALGPEYEIHPRLVLAQIYLEEGHTDKAIRAGEALRAMVDTAGTLIDAKELYSLLANAYHKTGDQGRAYDRLERFHALQDSLVNDENKSGMLRQEFRYAGEKRALSDSLTYASDKAVQLKEIQKQKVIRNGFVGGFALVAFFAGIFLLQRNRISKARKRSDELLLNILPAEVAEELKADGTSPARQFDSTTILFTDFKDFTQASEKMTPQELVAELNTCFKAFDHIITTRGIEKIKTIGDAYMCVGGLPDPKTSSPADVVHAALEMQAFMTARKMEHDAQSIPAFEMRVGIHTGPVVAGIVGVKKFQYDIWGDTVNTASRMESSGEVGHVNISEATYALIKDDPGFVLTSRGKVKAKGKGEMEMYFVNRST